MIIKILSIACLGALIACFSGIVQSFKERLRVRNINTWTDPLGQIKAKRLKPFDCEICMAFWLGVFYFWSEGINCLPLAATSSVTALFIVKIANKI